MAGPTVEKAKLVLLVAKVLESVDRLDAKMETVEFERVHLKRCLREMLDLLSSE